MYINDNSVIVILLLFVSCCILNSVKNTEAFVTFGFDIHHRYSDAVKDYFAVDGLPEIGTLDYYAAMGHRDKLFKARRLADTTPATTTLNFKGGNETFQLSALGYLHYAIVTVGTPGLTFLVALDTGSDLFWLPCDCTSCVHSINTTSGKNLDLNIYSPSTSSTSMPVPCNSTLCGPRRGCSVRRNACAYQDVYLSANTSSTGILVEEVLQLETDDSMQKSYNAPITLGCGIIQTGDFLDGAAPNGLFGLGMDNVSVPSTLANKGILPNSFSMCFGTNGTGRIDFGDKGSRDQKVTPFNLEQTHPTYNITLTQIIVGNTSTDVEVTAVFDSGTSFTYLNDPAYSVITDSFNSQITEPRYQPEPKLVFDYCYDLSPSQTSFYVPVLNLTMKGGNQFAVKDPIILLRHEGGIAFCLAVVKSDDIDIIGQNFMTGYRLVFDREEMVLGWKDSDCYDSIKNGSNTFPINKNNSTAPSPSVLQPEATPGNTFRFPAPPTGNNALRLRFIKDQMIMVLISIFIHQFIILSS